MSITLMFSQSPRSTSGNDSFAFSQLKKVSCTAAQPGLVTSNVPATPSTTIVLNVAMSADRRCRLAR